MTRKFTVVDLNYISLYIEDYEKALAFYTEVFGPSEQIDEGKSTIYGWKMGGTYLTIFDSKEGTTPGKNPGNTEFAVQVSKPAEVDILYNVLVEAGAKPGWKPEDTWMYEPMRFSYVDDPFGVRIDVICPLPKKK